MPTGNLGFFTMDAQGRITYTFAGRILAEGADFETINSGSFNPTDTSQIRWLRDDNGIYVASIYGARFGTTTTLGLQVRSNDQAFFEGANLTLQSDTVLDEGNSITLSVTGTDASPSEQRALLRADGTSGYAGSGAYGQYFGNGSANGTTPLSNWAWNKANASANWANFVQQTAAPRTNDTIKFLKAGRYHVISTVHLAAIVAGGWGRVDLIAAGASRSQGTFSGNNGLQNASATVNAIITVAVNDVLNIVFTARGAAETIIDGANDTRSSLTILYLGD